VGGLSVGAKEDALVRSPNGDLRRKLHQPFVNDSGLTIFYLFTTSVISSKKLTDWYKLPLNANAALSVQLTSYKNRSKKYVRLYYYSVLQLNINTSHKANFS
jgi:hypothetical protein